LLRTCASPIDKRVFPFSASGIELLNSPDIPISSPVLVKLKVYFKNCPIGISLNILIPLSDNWPSYLIPSSPENAKENA
jgi:hypothetical protein